MYRPIIKTHKARKQWRCDAGFTCYKVEDLHRSGSANLIEPGEQYLDQIYPPWTPTQEDPDSPVTKLGEWVHRRTHFQCGDWL